METANAAEDRSARLRDEVQAVIKEIIADIKMTPEGPEGVSEDALLFSDGLGDASPLEMDSLDALDLALALKERFDPEGSRFEAFLNGEVDLQALGTVRKITDYVLSLATDFTINGSAATVAAADERVPTGYP